LQTGHFFAGDSQPAVSASTQTPQRVIVLITTLGRFGVSSPGAGALLR